MKRLAIHTITTRPWSPDECIRRYAEAGVSGITFWRHDFAKAAPGALARRCADAGLDVVSLARGGFFPWAESAKRQAAIDDNRRAIDEAESLGAPSLVLVCGADPAQSLGDSRAQIRDGIASCLDHAAAAGVVLAIEPLHPMYADTRSAINTMAQANEACEALGSHPSVGIACDVYHTWWDPNLESEIARAGKRGNLTAFHICDWSVPTTDFLNDRAIPGQGCIDIPVISSWVEASGFAGYREVEIFSDQHWARDQDPYLKEIIDAYTSLY